MADIFVTTRDTNGLWQVSNAFKTELAKLSGAEPVWKVFFTPTENQADWVEIDGLIKTGSITQQVERELHTYMAMSCSLTFDNSKGQWNRRGFWQNQIGKTLKECKITDSTKDSIEGLERAKYNIVVNYKTPWEEYNTGKPRARELYVSKDGKKLFVATEGSSVADRAIFMKKEGLWIQIGNPLNYDLFEKKFFSEKDGNIFFGCGRRILQIRTDNNLYSEFEFMMGQVSILGMILFQNNFLLYIYDAFNEYSSTKYAIYSLDIASSSLTKIQEISTPEGAYVMEGTFLFKDDKLWFANADRLFVWKGKKFKKFCDLPSLGQDYARRLCICQDILFITDRWRLWKVTETGIVSVAIFSPYTITDLLALEIDKMLLFLDTQTVIKQYDAKKNFTNLEISLPILNTSTRACKYENTLYISQWNSGKIFNAKIRSCSVYKNNTFIKKVDIISDGIEEHTSIIEGMTLVFNQDSIKNDMAIINLGWFADRNIYEEKIRLWKGFRLPNGDCEYVPAFTGMIDRVSISDIGATANIFLIDLNKKLLQVTAEKVTMDNSDGTLTTKLNVSDEIPAEDGGGRGLLKTATRIHVMPPIDKFPSSGKIKIGNEIIAYTVKETILGTYFDGCTRGADLTNSSAHRDGSKVENYQWYIAPRMDRAVERLITEANITDYQIDETITQTDFKHFSYHGKTPAYPPFGVCRCICYDNTRRVYWMGIDDKLYMWKNGIWIFKKSMAGYIYQIAVREGTDYLYLVVCSLTWVNIDDQDTPEDYENIGIFKLCKYNTNDNTVNYYTNDNYRPFYAVNVGPYEYFPDARWIADSRQGFIIDNDKLFFCYYKIPFGPGTLEYGIASLDLATDIFSTIINYRTTPGFSYASIRRLALTKGESNICYAIGGTKVGGIGRTFLHSINTNTLVVTQLHYIDNTDTDSVSPYYSIPEIVFLSDGTQKKIFSVVCDYQHNFGTGVSEYFWKIVVWHYTTSWNVYLLKKFAKDSTVNLLDDCPRSFLLVGNVIYFLLGTGYSQGTTYKLYFLQFSDNIVDVGIPIAGEKGTPCNLLYIPAIGDIPEKLFGVSYPQYILWQYSTEAVISAFNQADFRASYGVTPISSLLKSFAIASNFMSYFDELGKYYFVKKGIGENVIIGFAEEDITNLQEEGGNLAEYPIINKAVVVLLDGTTQIYELPPSHPSRVKFGLETIEMSNPWINNPGVAYGIAKELVETYAMPKPLLSGKIRWFPLLMLNRLITLIKPSLGIWIKPK
ncbi:TPA: hypothetical protein DCX16_06300, partial [bacterium]|nr:hypothetical protein [bacterium]